MRAIVRSRYGEADVLGLREVETPTPAANEVLVRVRASSINMADVDYVRGRPWATRFATGLRAPKHAVPGIDLAGEVEAVGEGASTFAPGDRVFADLVDAGSGAWAEFVSVPESALVSLPEGIPWTAAGATPSSGIFGLQGVRDKRPVGPGDRVLVNGASGNVGPFAVQIAKSMGAHVTGVCRTEKMAMVRSIGADDVIDYTAQDYRTTGERYDLIVDIASSGHLAGIRHSLRPGGGYVLIGGSTRAYLESLLVAPIVGLATRRKLGLLMWRANDHKDLSDLAVMLADGRLEPHIDRTVGLPDLPEAFDHVAAGKAQGKVVVIP